jgi:DnaJ-class molecular chaperone
MNPYDVLEISKNATERDIKNAYKIMARKWHPDKNSDSKAEEKFKEIDKAYRILIDPELKAKYDQTGSVDPNQVPNVDINEILRNMGGFGFGGFPGFPGFQQTQSFHQSFSGFPGFPQGHTQVFVNGVPMNFQDMNIRQNMNLHVQLELSLQEIFDGVNKKINYHYKNLENNETINDLLDLNINRGVYEGQEFIIKNSGNKYKDNRGDLNLKIKESKHPKFIRNSNNPSDLTYNMKITLAQSICGFEIVIKGLDHQKLLIKNNSIIKNGDKKIIKNQGMHIFERNERGHLIIVFEIIYPDSLTNEMRDKVAEAFEYDNKTKYSDTLEFIIYN